MKNFTITIMFIFQVMCFTALSWGAQYKYDNLHRLTRVIYDNGMQITYTYDEVGNRTQRISTLQGDVSVEGTVNFQDFTIIASRWFDDDCISPNWCDGADIDWSGRVDIEDLVILAQQWLESVH